MLNSSIRQKISEADIQIQTFVDKKDQILTDTSDIKKFLNLILNVHFINWDFKEFSKLIDKIFVYDRYLHLGKKVQKISIFYKHIGCISDILIDLHNYNSYN